MNSLIRSHRAFVARRPSTGRSRAMGMTLIELIVATGILMTLASAAIPIARMTIRRQKEAELRRDLREMRDAIDRYKDAADKNQIRVEAATEGYPPDLDTLVKGVPLAGGPGQHVRFLRRIPVDPMTGTTDWGLRSVQDDVDSNSWGGQDVFDVFTKSTGAGIDGTQYTDW